MLITGVNSEYLSEWRKLAKTMEAIFGSAMVGEEGFEEFILNKVTKREALMAIDRTRRNSLMGIITFSVSHNSISWFAVFPEYQYQGVGSVLLKCALNQLNRKQDITVITFREGSKNGQPARAFYKKHGFVEVDNAIFHHNQPRCLMKKPAEIDSERGESFHFNYSRYVDWTNPERCPVCRDEPESPGYVLIKELEHSWLGTSQKAQGRLWGKCSILCKKHFVELFDMPRQDLLDFMTDVQIASKALKKVTGAVKINYEVHGNTMPHLHMHLFPRYIDDAFPSAPIDYRISEPSPYSDEQEFNLFVRLMRQEIGNLCATPGLPR